MRDHIGTGKYGEDLAVDYLAELGFKILDRNWRHRRSEIDIVAARENILHIIEVKTRTTSLYGFPEESINNKKIKALMTAAAAYCFKHPGWKIVQYDCVSILMNEKQPPDYLLIEDISV